MPGRVRCFRWEGSSLVQLRTKLNGRFQAQLCTSFNVSALAGIENGYALTCCCLDKGRSEMSTVHLWRNLVACGSAETVSLQVEREHTAEG